MSTLHELWAHVSSFKDDWYQYKLLGKLIASVVYWLGHSARNREARVRIPVEEKQFSFLEHSTLSSLADEI